MPPPPMGDPQQEMNRVRATATGQISSKWMIAVPSSPAVIWK